MLNKSDPTKRVPLTVFESIQQLSLPESFAEAHIPIREALQNNIYLLNNGDLGVVYKISGLYDEPLTEEELSLKFQPIYKFLRRIVLGIPDSDNLKNIVVQLICSQREYNDIPPKTDRKQNPLSFSDTSLGHLLQAEEEKLFSMGLVKRDFYMCIRYCVPKKKESFFSQIANLASLFFNENQSDTVSGFEKARSMFEIYLEPLELELRTQFEMERVNTYDLFTYYENILHAGKGQNLIFADESEDLHKNIYNPPMESKPSGLHIKHLDGSEDDISVFCLSQIPSAYTLGLLRSFIDVIPFNNFDLCWIFSEGTCNTFDIKGKRSWFDKGSANQKIRNNLDSFDENISFSAPFGKQTVRLIGYNVTKAQAAQVQTASLDYIGARMVPESQIGVHMIATSLPLGCGMHQNKITGRYQTIRLENALSFIPLYDGPKSKSGIRWWASRVGTPMRFDLFEGEGARMISILGSTGSGKSCLTSQLFLEFMESNPDGIIRIIDKKTSYKKLADLYGGKIIKFSEDNLRKNPYSPFALKTWDTDDIENIFVILATAIAQKNPGINFTAAHSEILLEAIKLAYNDQLYTNEHAREGEIINPHPVWNDIKSKLDTAVNNKSIANGRKLTEEIASWTVSLEETGQYGFLFSLHENMGTTTEDARFLVYDLDGISDPVLRVIAGQMAFLKITRDLAKKPRRINKLLAIDEFGMLIAGEDEATQKMNVQFVRNVVKTARKFNTIVAAITNEVLDFSENIAGRTMWSQTSHNIFLPLTPNIVSTLEKTYPSQFNKADIQILGSLRLNGLKKHSEVYLKSKTGFGEFQGSFFVSLTPFMNALVTTSGSECEHYETLLANGMEPAQALTHMATHHPYGEGLASKPKPEAKSEN